MVYKERASAFFGTPLIVHLRRLGVESLIICGESTSGCVRASTVDAYSTDSPMSLVEECTFDRSLLSHKVNLFDLHHKYADVMHVDEVIAHLEGLSRGRAPLERGVRGAPPPLFRRGLRAGAISTPRANDIMPAPADAGPGRSLMRA